VVAAAWGGAQASCYPANLGRPWFQDGGRAHRLAHRLGLDPDPVAVSAVPCRAAIEVYPHAALVSLFDLPVTLKYKAGRCPSAQGRRSRTVDERRAEFGRLVGCLQALRDRTPPLRVETAPAWTALVRQVADARTGADLDRVEDELDAYVCAYVGRHYQARRGRADSVVIGDHASGYIVTPVDARRRPVVLAVARDRGVPIFGGGADDQHPEAAHGHRGDPQRRRPRGQAARAQGGGRGRDRESLRRTVRR
jgi:predicted RNase H-like nuclease